MAKERISKLQRWILEHAYMKQRQMEMPEDWVWCLNWPWENDPPPMWTNERMFLFKYDILSNYFHLKRSRIRGGSKLVYFESDRANNFARVTLHNCLKNMESKGLVEVLKNERYPNHGIIALTKKRSERGVIKDKEQ